MAEPAFTAPVSLAPVSLAIVIVNYRTADLTIQCVEALASERPRVGAFDVIVVDGNSADGSAEKLTQYFSDAPWSDWVSVLPLDLNGGFGWANNQAMLRLLQRDNPPDYIHLLNPDAQVEPGAIQALLDVIESDPRIGAVASQLLEPDGSIAGSAFRFPSPGREFVRGIGLWRFANLLRIGQPVIEFSKAGPAEWITGASVLFRSTALRQTGLFDDGFFLYFEEVELMHRMSRAGWALWSVPASRVTHIGGASTGVASGSHLQRPHPVYRYESRRRYFVRANGATGLIVANLAWLFGRALRPILQTLRGRGDPGAPKEVRMTLRHAFLPARSDFHPSIPRWDEPPGRPPAWLPK